MAVQKIFFATRNKNKLNEMADILGPSFDVIGLNIDLPELQGEIEDIAKGKCKIAYEKYKRLGITEPIIVEDTALCFNALEGLPGPYIKWFLNKMGSQSNLQPSTKQSSIVRDERSLNSLTRGNDKLYELIEQYDDPSAQAICTYCFMENDEPVIIQGVVNGQIVKPVNGQNGFGWDPIFKPDGYTKTFAEMNYKEKNKISHRAKASNKLREYLVNRR